MTTPKGLLFDVTACVLCGSCVLADREKNALPAPGPGFPGEELSAGAFLSVTSVDGHAVRHSCMHCLNPACASACPVAALEKTDIGAVVYHGEKCIGCRYCMLSCPFGVPRYEWSEQLPYVKKCDLCVDRITDGRQPACSDACPTGALIFGDRSELLRIARERISGHASHYVDRIYGEHEAGGTSLLILSDIPLERLGYPAGVPMQPLPALTWDALGKIPGVVMLGCWALGGLHWLTKRRQEVLAAESPDSAAARRDGP